MELAKRGVNGRSRMTKAELVDAIQKANDKPPARRAARNAPDDRLSGAARRSSGERSAPFIRWSALRRSSGGALCAAHRVECWIDREVARRRSSPPVR